MTRSINYGQMMHRAMRGLIQNVLSDIAKHGLPGDHHFFITFRTDHDGVGIADWLHSRYPEEMTVVIQNWYENLEVDDDGFSITLNFGDQPEPLRIPFDAVQTFVDPSVEFGLRFETSEEDEDDDPEEDDIPAPMAEDAEPDAPPHKDADIVSLDSFRK